MRRIISFEVGALHVHLDMSLIGAMIHDGLAWDVHSQSGHIMLREIPDEIGKKIHQRWVNGEQRIDLREDGK